MSNNLGTPSYELQINFAVLQIDTKNSATGHNTSQSRKKKVMVTVWWPSTGLMYHSFIKPNKTITTEKYCKEIDEMHQKLACKQPVLINRKDPILLHDNPRLHVSIKLHTLNYEVLDHPHIHLTSHLQVFTFSNILITSCRRNASEIRTLKWHSIMKAWSKSFHLQGKRCNTHQKKISGFPWIFFLLLHKILKWKAF